MKRNSMNNAFENMQLILPALSASLTFAPALRTFFNCFKSPFLEAICTMVSPCSFRRLILLGRGCGVNDEGDCDPARIYR